MRANRSASRITRGKQAGLTIIETMIALALLLIVAAGIMTATVISIPTTENQGHLAARATEYAQDKMEQLMALKMCDPSSDTTVFPAAPAGGTGLVIGGSSPPAGALAGYVDYLDQNGNLLTGGGAAPPANWYFRRQWQITALPAALMTAACPAGTPTTMIQISVTATVRTGIANSRVPPPQATVVSEKSFPF